MLEFRANFPEASVDLDLLTMYLEAAKAVLHNSLDRPPTATEVIEFSKVVATIDKS